MNNSAKVEGSGSRAFGRPSGCEPLLEWNSARVGAMRNRVTKLSWLVEDEETSSVHSEPRLRTNKALNLSAANFTLGGDFYNPPTCSPKHNLLLVWIVTYSRRPYILLEQSQTLPLPR